MPIDYLSYQQNVASPLQQSLAGYQTGVGIRKQQAQQAQVELQQQQALQMRTDLASLAMKEDAGAEDYAQVMTKYPTMSEHFKRAWDVLSTEQQKVKQGQALNVFSALSAGQNDMAKKMLEEQKTAAENAGLKNEADSAEALLSLVEANPEAAKTSAGLLLSSTMGPEKFAETWTKLQSEQRERELQPGAIKKQAVDLGLTEAQVSKTLVNVKKLGAEAQKAVLELEAMSDGQTKIIDPIKRFEKEGSLRNEYTRRIKAYTESKRTYENMKASVNEGGPGDVALVTSFMKMLDPGSVVRETEFATARDTAGLLTRLSNIATKLRKGDFLSSDQRNQFVKLAGKYLDAAEKQQQAERKGIEKVVENYGLNGENVFSDLQPSYMKFATPTTGTP